MSAGYTGVLTGRPYPTARSTGYAEWAPRGDYRALLDAAHGVLATLAADDLVPIGPRAVGYRLLGTTVGGRRIVKSRDEVQAGTAARRELFDFGHVGDVLNRGRRAGLIPWGWVSDGGAVEVYPDVFTSAHHFVRYALGMLDHAQPDRSHDQPRRVEVWCEAVDYTRLVTKVVSRYGVPVFSARGWSGPYQPYAAANRWVDDGRPVTVLYFGDYDNEGLTLADRTLGDTLAFVAGRVDVEVVHLGVTEAQARDWNLATEPAKRSKNGRDLGLPFFCQADALPPDRLRRLLVDAIEERFDPEITKVNERRWTDHRALVKARLAPVLSMTPKQLAEEARAK